MVVKLPDSCVAVGAPYNSCSWSAELRCPKCMHGFCVTVTPGAKSVQAPHWCMRAPSTPPCTIRQSYWPPPLNTAPSPPVSPLTVSDVVRRLSETLQVLRLSGWYYGNLELQAAQTLLKDASVGAFIIRDSGDRKFIFSLSVQTERGPTSVRLHFEDGYFRLDCDSVLARYMPRFKCVIELIQHYTRLGQRGAAGTMWVDQEGCPHSPVLLTTPLRKSPPSLLHSARLAVHKALDSNPLTPKILCAPKYRRLPLPSALLDYLGEYPYSI
ncbi:suppressor of cytokine signaling 2-like isoform X2 [Hyposmocoma kahamanoa]|uniref:suppressor of cytokine signaling 2-like isoform X2 n=1 Tax=Hyposmocoma kahamanoa TaxID=1477025 RepID=UPI000E6DA549|nr:suppressor of cytokine signaling 2-like isoform X2 [Hyposmocoma kahamanoa]